MEQSYLMFGVGAVVALACLVLSLVVASAVEGGGN